MKNLIEKDDNGFSSGGGMGAMLYKILQAIDALEDRLPHPAVLLNESSGAIQGLTPDTMYETSPSWVQVIVKKPVVSQQKTEKEWNPERDGFWAWSYAGHRTRYINSKLYDEDYLAIGNWYRTQQEAEDIGKWLFETKLMLDKTIRPILDTLHELKIVLFWSDIDSGRIELYDYENEKKYCNSSFIIAIKAILGTHAKRYLTGKV